MVEKSSLGALSRLGNGASGDVYAIVGDTRVLKVINAKAARLGAIEWAIGAVSFWHGLSAHDQGYLASVTVWPTELVEDSGRVIGVLMPRIPDEYFHTRDRVTGRAARFDTSFKWLMQARADLGGGSLDADVVSDPAVKFALLAQTAGILAWLHAHGVVFGDISSRNFVFALNPPRALFLDCDGVVTSAATSQGLGRNTNPYHPPEHLPVPTTATTATDVWKMAVMTLCVLLPGKGGTQRGVRHLPQLQGVIPTRLYSTLGAALEDDPAKRAPMADLAAVLAEVAAQLNQPPVAHLLELSADVVRHGKPVTLRWALGNAETVVVDVPGGKPLHVTTNTHPSGCTFVPEATGLVGIHASNRHGTSSFAAGPVVVYHPPTPTVHISDLGLPSTPPSEVPSVQRLSIPRAGSFGPRADGTPRLQLPSCIGPTSTGLPSASESLATERSAFAAFRRDLYRGR